MVVIVCFLSTHYSARPSIQAQPDTPESRMWMMVQAQKLQIDQLDQKINNLQAQLSKYSMPVSIRKQVQRDTSEGKQIPQPVLTKKQLQLFESYNKIPVKLYVNNLRDRTWTLRPELCQNLTGFQSAKLHTVSGVMDVYIHDPKDDKWVSGSLANGHVWESGLVNLVLTSLKKGKHTTFIDIGANLGIYSLFAAKNGFKVISIEPLKINVQRMCSSLRAGHLTDKVTIVRGALSDVSQNVSLGIDVNNVGGSFVLQDRNKNKVKDSKVGGQYSDIVMSTTLDNILQLPGLNLTRAVIKMDVEGYEHKVVRGGTEFFDSVIIPTVLMEWAFHKGADSGTEIIHFFETRNYTAYDPLTNIYLHSKSSNTWPPEIIWRKKV
ncbi:uncharacterized protein LOC132545052 [Ylistrum balloti]|uniref:uncharacterized protein LOC132545052 n=1 Tax=Ylistrum balloti TaxID=509963 RepID=UPI002905AB67|nr:uncharacterized protein LOC132545052 [Ylistrum balloti]